MISSSIQNKINKISTFASSSIILQKRKIYDKEERTSLINYILFFNY